MENLSFGGKYSSKNIPLPSKKEYKKQLIYAVKKFINNLRWRVFFHKMKIKNETDKEKKKHEDHPDVQDVLNNRNNFGFKSGDMAPEVPELVPFEQAIYEMISKIDYKHYHNNFLKDLEKDLENLRKKNVNKVIVAADKTRNLYKCSAEWYKKTVRTEITKDYRGVEDSELNHVNEEAADIAEKLGLEKRMQAFPKKEVYVTTTDHKEDFARKPKFRLINSAKPDIGRVSREKLQDWMKRLRTKLDLNQWRSTQEVIDWFNGLENKQELKFIKFDIESFYPSITKELLNKTIKWAKSVEPVHIGCSQDPNCEKCNEDFDIIYAARKNFVFNNGKPFRKKGEDNFDVTMGAWDGAEVAELVGLYLLFQMSLNVFEKNMFGLYRDDGLAVTRRSKQSNEFHLKPTLRNVFRAAGLGITIEINLVQTDFLDLELNLKTGTHSEWRKPGDSPQYINTRSNHPPNIIKQIPTMVAKRLSRLSSNEEIFDNQKGKYEKALEDSGYSSTRFKKNFGNVEGYDGKNLKYIPKQEQKVKKKRQPRQVTWFNPPFNLNVRTDIGKKFLNLVKKHFKKGGKIDQTGFNLSKILNIHTVKLSYSTTNNIARQIVKHNNKALKQNEKLEQKKCNCRINNPCPFDGDCGVGPCVYQADIIEQDRTMHYIGMTGRTAKERCTEHRNALRNRKAAERQPTRLSKHVWSLKDKNIQHDVKWKIKAKTGIYFPGAKYCDTCITEAMFILDAERTTSLNLRTEILSKCKHMRKFTLHDMILLPRKKKKK